MFIQSLLVNDFKFTTAWRALYILYMFYYATYEYGERAGKKFGSGAPTVLRADCLTLSRLSTKLRIKVSPLVNRSINQPRCKSCRSREKERAVIRYIARNFMTAPRIARPCVTQEMIDRQAEVSLHPALLVQNSYCTHNRRLFHRRIDFTGDIFFLFEIHATSISK